MLDMHFKRKNRNSMLKNKKSWLDPILLPRCAKSWIDLIFATNKYVGIYFHRLEIRVKH